MMSLVISLAVVSPSAAQAPHPPKKSVTQLTAKQYAKQELLFRGYRLQDWKCLDSLWTKESNWNHKSKNKHSSAFGIAQVLKEKSHDPVTQINNGLRYIEYRYGNPCNAWEFWTKKKWY